MFGSTNGASGSIARTAQLKTLLVERAKVGPILIRKVLSRVVYIASAKVSTSPCIAMITVAIIWFAIRSLIEV